MDTRTEFEAPGEAAATPRKFIRVLKDLPLLTRKEEMALASRSKRSIFRHCERQNHRSGALDAVSAWRSKIIDSTLCWNRRTGTPTRSSILKRSHRCAITV